MLSDEDKEFIRDTIYEVIEPFVIQMSKDYGETRQWMSAMSQRMEAIEQRRGVVEQRLGVIEQRLTALEKSVATLRREVASLDRRVGRLEEEVAALRRDLTLLEQRLAERGFVESEAIAREKWATFSDVRALELRVTQLEVAVFQRPQKSPGAMAEVPA